MKVGLFFGSFNPIHTGHLIIASYVMQHSHLQKIWFVVSPHNPFKETKGLLNEYHRLALVNIAIEGDSRFAASDIEFGLPRPSYTIDTLTYLQEKYPTHEFSIIMGADSFQNLSKWKNGASIRERYPIYVYRRLGFEVNEHEEENLHFLHSPIIEISSTRIREMIKKGETVRWLIPDNVKEEIEKGSYYR